MATKANTPAVATAPAQETTVQAETVAPVTTLATAQPAEFKGNLHFHCNSGKTIILKDRVREMQSCITNGKEIWTVKPNADGLIGDTKYYVFCPRDVNDNPILPESIGYLKNQIVPEFIPNFNQPCEDVDGTLNGMYFVMQRPAVVDVVVDVVDAPVAKK